GTVTYTMTVLCPCLQSVAGGQTIMLFPYSPLLRSNEAASAAGAVVSCTLTNWVCVLLLPWLSLKVHVIVWLPWPKGPVTSATPVIGPSQASVAVGAAGRRSEHRRVGTDCGAGLAADAVVSWTLSN